MFARFRVPTVLLLLLGLTAIPAFSEDAPADPAAEARKLRAAGNHGGASALLAAALEKTPGDATLLHEMGLTAEAHAREILASTTPALGRLGLQDAMSWFRKAIAARPDWPDPLKGLGRIAIMSREFALASDSYGKAAALDPKDGEARYQLGYALAYERRFREAVEAFRAAEALLGPQPRILLNMGISYVGQPDAPKAKACLLRLVRTELKAGRPNSSHCKGGVFWLWKTYSQSSDYGRAEDVFGVLTEEFPDYSGGHWYLGYARWLSGRYRAAAGPFRRVLELTPRFAACHRLLTLTLARAEKFDEALVALEAYAALGADGHTPLPALLEIATGLAAKKRYDRAIEALGSFEDLLPDDPELIERRADLMFRADRLLDAVTEYRRAAEFNPFSDAPEVKAQKAITRLLRRDELPSEGDFRRKVDEEEPSEGGVIYDFEGSTLFPRMSGRVTGGIADGVFRVERQRDPGEAASIRLTLMPTFDTRPYASIRCTVRGIEGESFRLMAKDGFDEFGSRMIRIAHRDVITFTGMPRQVVTFPLDGFEAVGRPEIPFQRDRLRALVFEIGLRGSEEEKPSSEIHVHDVTFVAADGTERLLTDFTDVSDETMFLPGGAASAFARTLFRAEEAAAYRADPNTFARRELMGAEFDPSFVHAGEGAFRLTLPAGRGAEAWGVLTLAKARAETVQDAVAITFWARGAMGDEKLRVTIVDALDESLKIETPTQAPRLEMGPTLVEGRYTLTREWRRYRISRAAYPDIDFGSLRRIRFDFGMTEGNAAGTVLFLDDIRWE